MSANTPKSAPPAPAVAGLITVSIVEDGPVPPRSRFDWLPPQSWRG